MPRWTSAAGSRPSMRWPSKVIVPPVGLQQTGDAGDGGGLARAVETEQHGGLARLHVEVDALQHRQRAVAHPQRPNLE